MDKGSDDRPTMVGLLAMKSAPSTAFAESKFLSLGGAVALASTLLTPTAQAQELPTGGQVVAGQGSIASTSTTMTVTQNTANMAVNWQSFSIGQGNTVNFVQPSASAVALNRVLGSDVSVIQGALNANGKIFLINPNGVLFTPTAQVNVGSLVASTLNISTDDFMAGNYRFEGASSNAITNQGNITTANDGTVALIAAKIINTGQIDTPQGNVLMAAGNKVTLDMGGPVKIQVEKGALEALIEQGGGVRADGGLVYLTAKAAGELATAVINHTGITEARTLATGEKGEIILLGDMAQGETIVGGRLDASAPNGGDGGFIETSAAEVRYLDGFLVTAGSTYGTGGLWLIDPADAAIDQTIADGYVATLNTGTSVLNEVTGNITLNNGVSIAKTAGSDATLTFKATGNIVLDVNSSITSTSGALNTVLWADSDATSGGYIHIKNGSTIKTNGGAISLVGGTDGTGYAEGTSTQTVDPPHQDGISIYGSTLDSRVYISGTPQTSGGGTITLKGKGYAGNLVNHGGGLWAGYSSIDTGGGDLIMDVQAQESIGATEVGIRYGAYIDGTTISTNGGNVQISTASPDSTWTGFHSNSSLNAGTGDITIATDQISLNGATFSGTGALSVQPITSGTTIGLAGGAGTLNINATEWGYFQNGFSSITIGNSTSGAITVGGSVTSNDDLNLINNSTIAINGALTVNNNLTMTSGGAITQTQALDVNGTTTITAGAGNNITLNNTGNDFTGEFSVVSAAAVSVSDANSITLGDINMSGDLTAKALSGNLLLDGDILKDSGADATATLMATGYITLADSTYIGSSSQDPANGITSSITSTNNELNLVINPGSSGGLGGFWLPQGSSIQTNGGDITIGGGAGASSAAIGIKVSSYEWNSLLRGISINGTLDAQGGNITMIGQGSTDGGVSAARGVHIGGTVSTSGSGNISITGTPDGGSAGIGIGDGTAAGGPGSIIAEDGDITLIANDATGWAFRLYSNTSLIQTTGSGNLNLTSNGSFQGTGIFDIGGTTTLTAGTNNLSLINTSNDFIGAVSVISANALSLIDSNALSLGGVSTAGAIDIATLTGDMTLTGAVVTTDTSAGAVVLNAGKDTAAGTAAGGNIIVSGGSVSVGGGGTAKLYSGSVTGSTGLTALIGSGSGNFRYNSDETTTNYTTALATGNNAIYREQPSITVTATDDSKTYDGNAYSGGNGYTGSGFANGDTIASITGTPAYGGTSQGATNAGTYTLSLGSLDNGLGYALSYTDGTLTINKAALTISTADVTKTYDGTTSAAGLATVTAGTLFGSDAISGGTFAFNDKNAGSNKTVTVSGVTVSDGNSGNNYTVAYSNNNNSTINKATLTVTADDQTRPYGAPNPSFTQTISGFVNGENAITAGITGSAIGSSTATASSAAGAYVISGSTGSLAAGNYNFIAADGTLTIMATSPAQQSAVQAAQMLPPTGALPLSISGGLELVNVPGGTSDSMAPLVAQLPEGGTEALAEMVRLFVEDGGILYERDKRQ